MQQTDPDQLVSDVRDAPSGLLQWGFKVKLRGLLEGSNSANKNAVNARILGMLTKGVNAPDRASDSKTSNIMHKNRQNAVNICVPACLQKGMNACESGYDSDTVKSPCEECCTKRQKNT